MREPAPDALRLPEDVAHRLLARAVELDAARASEVPVGQLREIAREAGISAAALETAIEEMQARPAVVPPAPPRSRWESIAANVLAFVAFWGVLMLLVRLSRLADAGVQGRSAAIVAALLAGSAVSSRLRARPALFVLAGLALTQAAELAMDLVFRHPTVDGAGAHFALIIAGIGGVVLGALLTRHRSAAPPPTDATTLATDPAPTTPTPPQPGSGTSLRIRLSVG